MNQPGSTEKLTRDHILTPVRRYWGYDQLRPLQEKAIRAGVERRDSLVVLPTGGGKSLCYQVPPVLADRTDVVVSPLIALMKDQVDGLEQAGYPAAAVHSNLTPDERNSIERSMREGKYKLVFAAPERVVTPWFMDWMDRAGIEAMAIDEAHCISHWGHDFRPEYRQLASLRQRLGDLTLHAFTATATPRVREDIVAQLQLRDPDVLVGNFDRPNLIYRILPQIDVYQQTLEAIQRHAGEAAIVYCLSRKDTEAMASWLTSHGVRAAHYHAGMQRDERRATQDDFAQEKIDVVAATVAFGMGIDRSNVRCVVHATMPKSIEHYQQETGRAGRDGLEAECVLFYTAADLMRWRSLLSMNTPHPDDPAAPAAQAQLEAQLDLLQEMARLCGAARCRHSALVNYFGQDYEKDNCGACDVCLGEVDGVQGAAVIAQKILSCIARTDQRFGVNHIVDVLAGADTEQIRRMGHQEVSTYGLLADVPRKAIASYVYQLIDQDLIARSDGDRPTLALNDASLAVMRGQRDVMLIEPKLTKRSSAADADDWAGVDRDLFDALRQWRHQQAQQRDVPAYVICGDRSLRDLARRRPSSRQELAAVHGLGDKRIAEFGASLVELIVAYCRDHDLDLDVIPAPATPTRPITKRPNQVKDQAMQMFAQGASLDEVTEATGRASRTVVNYLADYITQHKPADVSAWIDDALYQRIAQATKVSTDERLRPIYEALDGQVDYADIHIVVAHQRAMAEEADEGEA